MTSGEPPDQAVTDGQLQARHELKALERVTEGIVTVKPGSAPGRIDITIDCSGESSERSDAQLEDRELFSILVGPRYPLEAPTVQVLHRRFAGLPHVVWGEYICLHVGDNDWDPNRGLQGLVDRLLAWLKHVAAGTLTGPDLPWDPPITRTNPFLGCLIVRPDYRTNWCPPTSRYRRWLLSRRSATTNTNCGSGSPT